MRLYDNVKLIEEVEELAKREIHEGYRGLIVGIDGDIYTTCFFNPKNFGESAYAKVNKKHLRFLTRAGDRTIKEMEAFFPNKKMDFNKCLSVCDVKEYDAVELIVEKPKYAMEGVHKGDRGCVISTYAIDNHWLIIFSERGTGRDIADISVDRKDFKIIDKF